MVKITLVNGGDVATLLLEGRIDAGSAQEIQDKLQEVTKRFDRLILDLKKVPYISSAGLRVLRIVHRDMAQKGGVLIIRNVRKDVMDVFNLTGFGILLDFEE